MKSNEPIRAITLWPEWAWAIAALGKNVENRGWRYPKTLHGGLLAIHAGATIGGAGYGGGWAAALAAVLGMAKPSVKSGPERDLLEYILKHGASPSVVQCSAVVAVARVDGIVAPDAEGVPWHVPGQYGWKLADIRVLPTPVPCKGKQGLWTMPDDVLARVREQLEGSR